MLWAALAILSAAPSLSAQATPTGTAVVANMSGRSTWLVDLTTGGVTATVPSREAPHEVAVSADGALAVVTNYGGQGETGNIVQVIDVAAGELVAEHVIDGYERLHGVAFLPGDSLLLLTAERSGELLVIGTDDGRVRRRLPTLGRASHMLSATGRWAWTANIVDGTVSRIDLTGQESTATFPAGERTEGIASSPDGREGWTGSMASGEVIAIDADSSRPPVRIPGFSVPYRLASTPDGSTIVVSDPAAGELIAIDRASRRVTGRTDVADAAGLAGLPGAPSPQGFVITPDGRWALVSAKIANRVVVVDLRTMEVLRFLEAGGGPDGIAFSPVRRR